MNDQILPPNDIELPVQEMKKNNTFLFYIGIVLVLLSVTSYVSYMFGVRSAVKQNGTRVMEDTSKESYLSELAEVVNEDDEAATPNNFELTLTYTSKKNNYSFKYFPEPQWYVSFADEYAPLADAHFISSYDESQIEKYKENGVVNWKNFVGDNSALSLRMFMDTYDGYVQSYLTNHGYLDSNQYVDFVSQYEGKQDFLVFVSEMKKNPIKIGGFEAKVYEDVSGYLSPDQRSMTFLVFPNKTQVLIVTVYSSNVEAYSDFILTQDWQDLLAFFASFKFNL